MFAAGACWPSVVVGGSAPTMWRPGASSSGLANPSCVRPLEEKLALRSSAVARVSALSVAPTVIANGSLPGA